MPPDTTCSPTSKDTTIVSGSIPPSGISPPNRQSDKPLNPVSTKSQEGHSRAASAATFSYSRRKVGSLSCSRRCASKTCGGVAPGGGLKTDQVKRMKELEAD